MQYSLYSSGSILPVDGRYTDMRNIQLPRTKDITLVQTDLRVTTLFNRLTQTQRGRINIDDKLEVVEQAIRLFGDFGHFMELQYIANNFMNGTNLDFLEDTTNYILTGNRRFPIHTWLSLVTEYPPFIMGSASRQRFWTMHDKLPVLNKVKLISPQRRPSLPSRNDYISMWCGHENGVIDMLYTMWILFGKSFSEPNY